LPPPDHDFILRRIQQRRAEVLCVLKRHGWEIEVWFMAGRRRYLNITTRYLPAMLTSAGGVASRVVWLHEEGQSYVPDFAKRMFPRFVANGSFEVIQRGNIRRMYRRSLNRPRTFVFKLDDDTVFVQPGALVAMSHALLSERSGASRCFVVSGNIVNHVGLNPVHYLLGALAVTQATMPHMVSLLKTQREASPRSVRSFQGVTYDGYQRNVLGSYQEPLEWRAAHLSFLTAMRSGDLSVFYFPSEVGVGGIFDFQCDGMRRRWGINGILFPPLGEGHFGAMRDLGHLVKNKDEVYFSMYYGLNVGGEGGKLRNHTCAVGDALIVHFLNTGQASNLRKAVGVPTDGSGADPRSRDASLLAPKMLWLYDALALHFSGTKRCCRSSGCAIFSDLSLGVFPLP